MPPTEILINLLLSCFSIGLTAVVGFVVKSISDRNEKRDRKEEEREKKRRVEHEALKLGVQAILRSLIIEAEIKSTKDGYISAEEKNNVELMYKAYHGLGGNGVATAAHKHIMDLPITGESHV